ncbi:variant chaperonin GroEL3 [Chlamydia gallinacea]|uniref:variant chaperonin GroEL3 n=1 Tax=Chlamydia gallinacea TaxID=1457153 RepID=UPI0024E1B563|nr:variant chaperonin GroEL3 [Chlamydia gallinacea]
MFDKEKLLYNPDKRLFLGIDKIFHLLKDHYGPDLNSPLGNTSCALIDKTILSDPYENIGVDFTKILSNKIYKKYHDGITTGVLLLYALLKNSYCVCHQELSPYQLSIALKKMGKKLLSALRNQSLPLKDKTKAKNIIFSAVPDLEIATEISEAFSQVGSDGFIFVSHQESTAMQITQGLHIPHGYIVPYFLMQSPPRSFVLSQPRIFVTDKKITTILHFLPLLQELSEHHESLLLVCQDIDPNVLSTLTLNRLEGLLHIVVVRIPTTCSEANSFFEDISLFTGTNVFSHSISPNGPTPERSSLGSCDFVEISEKHTMLMHGKGVSEFLKLKIHQIDKEIHTNSCQMRKTELIQRKRRLQSSVAILPIKETLALPYSIALSTLTSAIESGYIPGGGAGIFYAALQLNHEQELSEEEKAARTILQTSSLTLMEQLANAVQLDGKAITEKLISLETPSLGINVLSRQIEDLIASGVLDPLGKIEDIFSFALETAITILLTKGVIHAPR